MIEYFIVSRKTIVVIEALFMIIRRRLGAWSVSMIVSFLIGLGNGGNGDPATTRLSQPVGVGLLSLNLHSDRVLHGDIMNWKKIFVKKYLSTATVAVTLLSYIHLHLPRL